MVFDATTCLSVRVWDDGNEELPSDVQDEVYIIDEFDPDIPTFSILVNEDDLWDWDNGIYVMGPNAAGDYPTSAPILAAVVPVRPHAVF